MFKKLIMKKTILFFAGLFLGTISFAQNCNIGNEDTTGFTISTGNFTQDYLLGVKYTLNSPGILHSLNLIGNNTGSQVQMALYDDNGGVPNNLIAQSGIDTVGIGLLSLPVTATQLAPGDYWIMAIYDTSAVHTYKNTQVSTNVIYYQSLIFGSQIPTNASGFTTYTGQEFTYFIGIECGTVGIEDIPNKNLSAFPNPVMDILHFSNIEKNTQIEIYDLLGKKVLTTFLDKSKATIDISSLNSGTYLLKAGNTKTIKIIKE